MRLSNLNREALRKKIKKPPLGYRTPAALLLLGILSTVLLLWTSHTSEHEAIQDLTTDDAIRQLEIAVATSHLWLEEALSGDPSIDITEIRRDLDRSVELVLLVLQGGTASPGGYTLEPLREPELRRQAEEVRARLVELTDFSIGRYSRGGVAGVGTEMDQNFDEKFLYLLRLSDGLRQGLAERSARLQARSRRRLSMLMTAWIVLVTAASAGLFNQERRRRQAEITLRQREAELHQAQKMEAVGRLAGGIAHDINNYLGAIRGYCEVAALKNPGNPALARQMDAAMQTATEASNLIRQLLAFSRKQPVAPRVVNLNRIVAKMEGMARQLLGDDVILSSEQDPEVWSVEVDPSQTEQILLNLLVNSRDAMPTGGEIVVKTRNLEQGPEQDGGKPVLAPGRYAVLSVVDTGHGIPPEFREKIFEPFFTTKADMGSSGVGLATVYGIVRQNGGSISVASEPGKGTTIEIFLPAHDRQASDAEPRVDADGRPFTGPVKVLLVEDNDYMRAATGDLLKALGHDVLVTADAREALEIVAGSEPPLDLLVTDVVMPGLSGPELLSRIREKRRSLPCLFISGYSDNVVLRYGLDQEHADFLQKPFTARNLALKIGELVNVQEPGVS